MAEVYEEQDEVERVVNWLKDNWLTLVVGLVVGLAIVGGWYGWQAYKNSRAQSAAQTYQILASEFNKTGYNDQLASDVQDFQKRFRHSPYAMDASFALAAIAVESKEYDAALKQLDWVIDNNQSRPIEYIAQARKARVLWAKGDGKAALKTLQQDHPKSFDRLYGELAGDIYAQQGDKKSAYKAYKNAWKANNKEVGVSRLRYKLMRVAPAETAPETLEKD